MAIFKEQTVQRKDAAPLAPETFPKKDTDSFTTPLPSYEPVVRPRSKEAKESHHRRQDRRCGPRSHRGTFQGRRQRRWRSHD